MPSEFSFPNCVCMIKRLRITYFLILFFLYAITTFSQTTIKGIILDASNNDPIIGGTLVIQGTGDGTASDWDGTFEFSTEQALPFMLEFSYTGYETKVVEVNSTKRLEVFLSEGVVTIDAVTVKGSRISDKQKESPLTVESMDILAIKETPAANFYDGLGALKGVDLTAASLGFKVINMRGFNSTSPVRSLQIIDGVDNQAPGLNFSLGNFLGSSELDVNKVEIVVGASSAFYGPNAFNGVISMETKDPFFHDGLSANVKLGERNMLDAAVRWADKFQNKDGKDYFAYKVNLSYLRADDWVADNYDPVDHSRVPANNPGGFDAVNIYGDEYVSGGDLTDLALSEPNSTIGIFYRTGYREIDLVDYDTRNYKANAALHFRLKPDEEEQSPEIILSGNFGSGTTVYQGDNRFSLKGITFLQNRLELRKRNKYFVRAYTTRTGAGDSYDPYFTALQLQESSKGQVEWFSNDYGDYWLNVVVPQIVDSDYPKLEFLRDPETGQIIIDPETGQIATDFDIDAARKWLLDNREQLTQWHSEAAEIANGPGRRQSTSVSFFEPGTQRFQEEFDRITGSLRSEGGTKFFDNSALYHAHGEYIFTPTWVDKITVGTNARLYAPVSKGTVFIDSADIKITNREVGFYGGAEKSFYDNKMKATIAARADKNENFDWLFSPAASLVYTPSRNNYFRISYSSAIRNPTLSDQYLGLDVGRATLAGNLKGVQNLVTIESLIDFLNTQQSILLDSFNINAIAPEEVQTFEAGVRTTLFEKLYVDAGYYYSIYNNFIGFRVGADIKFDALDNVERVNVFRYAANSENQVETQGFSIGLNYFLPNNLALNGNYSWNKLVKTVEDDPIIPAFNTPEHKFNIGLSGRNLSMNFGESQLKNFGFNVNYKWIEGFIFEGSPQFTGFIPTYDMLDAQINFGIKKIDTTLKIGASNVLNNRAFQTYGGPRIGRLAYVTLLYEPK